MADKDPMTGLMDQIDSAFKQQGAKTSRKGNHITLESWADRGNAGRGGQGGPTAEQARQNKDMTQVPQDVDGASAGRKFKKDDPGLPEQPGSAIRVDKKAAGGTASSRADGCCIKGKTRGRMV